MDKQLASMEKTVVRGGDKAREFEYKCLVKVADHIKGQTRLEQEFLNVLVLVYKTSIKV